MADGRTVGERIRALGKDHLWSARAAGEYSVVVMHYISAVNRDRRRPYDLGKVLAILCELGVSAHFLVTRRGAVYQLAPVEARAWNALRACSHVRRESELFARAKTPSRTPLRARRHRPAMRRCSR